METITLKEYHKLSLNDPRHRVIGELFVMKYNEDDDLPDVSIGSIVGLMKVKRLTERGYEAIHRLYRVIK